MNKQEAFSYYASQLEGIRESGVLKAERIITTPQSAHIFADGKELLNMCANNYLGLADNRELAEAAKAAYDAYGYGLASVRFICGTQSIHKQLEAAVSRFFGTEDTILYSSCFDANGGLFEVTPPSSMASACAKPSGTVTKTTTWPIWRPSSRPPTLPAPG